MKRELLFWLVALAVMAGYIALGYQLTPVVPPEPKKDFNVIRLKNTQELQKELAKITESERAWKDAIRRHNEFLRTWYRWGVGLAIAMVLVYTLLRPPWRGPAQNGPQPRDRTENSTPRGQRISRRAYFQMAAVLVLILVVLALLATLIP